MAITDNWHVHPGRDCCQPPAQIRFADTATGTLTVRTCTCNYTWGTDDLGHVTEVRRPMTGCPTHPPQHCPGCQCHGQDAPA